MYVIDVGTGKTARVAHLVLLARALFIGIDIF
jgi:hypothetical protein